MDPNQFEAPVGQSPTPPPPKPEPSVDPVPVAEALSPTSSFNPTPVTPAPTFNPTPGTETPALAAAPLATPQPAPHVVQPTDDEPRNFLATFLLASLGGVLGLRHFYLGDAKLGWIRTGLYVGGVLGTLAAMGAQLLIIIAGPALIAASIWAFVDFFYVYLKVRTDAYNRPLTMTTLDKKWAKIIFLVTIVASVLYIILSIGYVIFSFNNPQFMKSTTTTTQTLDSAPLYE